MPRTKAIATLPMAVILAACSAAQSSPTPTYTRAQADACARTSVRISFSADAPRAQKLYYADQGELVDARKDAARAATKDAAIAAAATGTGADVELDALHTALAAGAVAFATSMTMPQFEAAYRAIDDASQAFSSRCRAINGWVEQNVSQ